MGQKESIMNCRNCIHGKDLPVDKKKPLYYMKYVQAAAQFCFYWKRASVATKCPNGLR